MEDYLKESLKHTEAESIEQVTCMLSELIKSFGNYCPLVGYRLWKLHKNKQYGECISLMRFQMGIQCRVKVSHYKDGHFEEKFGGKIAGNIEHLHNYPPYGSTAMKNYTAHICISTKYLIDYFEFVKVISHELAHIVLHSTGHMFKRSEIATDLVPFVFGFGEIIVHSKNSGYLKRKEMTASNVYMRKVYLKKYKSRQDYSEIFNSFLVLYKHLKS